MIGYKDKTWCTYDACNHFLHCDRAMTDEAWESGVEWWGTRDFPYSSFYEKPECFEAEH